MRRLLPLVAVLIALGTAPHLRAQVEGPSAPDVPDVSLRGEGEAPAGMTVEVFLAGGKKRSGTLLNASKSLMVPDPERGAPAFREVQLADIDELVIVQWRGRLKQGPKNKKSQQAYAFYPSRVLITLRDRSRIECADLPGFEHFRVYAGGKELGFFTWFYDYRVGNRWRSSGETALEYPETHPHPRVAVRIRFPAREQGKELQKIFDFLK